MSKKVIVQSITHMNRGGAETFIMNVFRNIDKDKYDMWFLLSSENGDYIKEITDLGGRIFTIGTRHDGLKYIANIYDFFKKHGKEIDVVHMHTSSLSSLEILWMAKMFGIRKRIIHSHNTNQDGLIHKALHYLNKPLLRFVATDCLACSQVAATWLYSHTGMANNVKVINNGVDVDKFRFSPVLRANKRKELGISSDALVLIHVGRFCDVKNHNYLVRLFANLQKSVPNSKLILVGRGELQAEIRRLTVELGIDKDVIFAGLQEDVSPWLQAADVFVMPSFYEGLPVALVEAQTSGISVVCSSNVSKEAKINPNCRFLSLDEPDEVWIDSIKELSGIRNVNTDNITSAGYDIRNTVKELEDKVY